MSEAQKYQGHLYRPEKEKKNKGQNQNQNQNQAQHHSQALVPQKASVEEIPDEYTGIVSIIEAPPEAPSPPSAVPDFAPNVFDFLVGSETPNASTLKLVEAAEADEADESRMIEDNHAQRVRFYDDDDDDDDEQAAGMVVQYDADPISTPAPRKSKKDKHSKDSAKESKSATKDKKRKRLHVDTSPQPPLSRNVDTDEIMADADADAVPVLHSGLTGGLNRLLSKNAGFPPSPDYSGDNGVDSPLRRSKRSSRRASEKAKKNTGLSATLAGFFAGASGSGTNRKESGSSNSNKENEREDMPRKSRHRDRGSKLLTDSSHARSGHHGQQMIIYDANGMAVTGPAPASSERAELFLSGVTKGTESEKGYSVNKALKRYHRERMERLGAIGKKEREEKELWKCLRLRRNDRGEVVVFFQGVSESVNE